MGSSALASRLSDPIPCGHCGQPGSGRTLAGVLDDADRPAVADHLDPSGSYRQALRAALLSVLIDRTPLGHACDRDHVRVPQCTMHGMARITDGPAG